MFHAKNTQIRTGSANGCIDLIKRSFWKIQTKPAKGQVAPTFFCFGNTATNVSDSDLTLGFNLVKYIGQSTPLVKFLHFKYRGFLARLFLCRKGTAQKNSRHKKH